MNTSILIVLKPDTPEDQIINAVPCVDNGDCWIVPSDCWDVLMAANIPYQWVHFNVRVD